MEVLLCSTVLARPNYGALLAVDRTRSSLPFGPWCRSDQTGIANPTLAKGK